MSKTEILSRMEIRVWERAHKGHSLKDGFGKDGDVVVRVRKCEDDGRMIVVSETRRHGTVEP